MRLLLVGLILLLSTVSYGQVITLKGAGNSVMMKDNYTTIEGSPFLYDDYRPGTITNVDGVKDDAILLKYDMYADKIVVFKDNSHLALNEGIFPEFTMSFFDKDEGNVQMKFVHALKLNIPGAKGYYEIVYDGEYKLLKKYSVSFVNKVVSDYGTASEIKRFDTYDMLLFVSPDGKMQEVKGGKSSLYELFAEHEEKAKDYAKKNDLNVKDTEDMVQLIEIMEREMTY